MKAFNVIAVAALSVFLSCTSKEDPKLPPQWGGRPFQARLSGTTQWQRCRTLPLGPGRAVEQVQCERPLAALPPGTSCSDDILTYERALQLLLAGPACIDPVIEALHRFSRADVGALNDLAVAYYQRAQWNDDPADLLQALQAAMTAVESSPPASPQELPAHYNLALMQESVGLDALAIDSWNWVQTHDEPAWAHEAAGHYQALVAKRNEKLPTRPAKNPRESALQARIETISLTLLNRDSTVDSIFRALAPLELEAQRLRSDRLLALIQLIRSQALANASRYPEALRYSQAAQVLYERVGEGQGVAQVRTRRSEIYNLTGRSDLAWRELLVTHRHPLWIRSDYVRTLLLTDTVKVASDLGLPQVSFLYADNAVVGLRARLKGTPPDELKVIQGLLTYLGIALRVRAGAELELHQITAADRDSTESTRILGDQQLSLDKEVIAQLEGRLEEVHAQRLLERDPAQAAGALTTAIDAAKGSSTRHVELLVRRAEAYRRARDPRAEADLQQALEILQQEERKILASHKPGETESLWKSYFSRFQETYQLLIRQRMEAGRPEDALTYAERARASEVMSLISRLPDVPPAVKRLARHDRDVPPESIPEGTFVIEYAVLDDVTYAWVIWSGGVQGFPLPVARADVERWSRRLQQAGALQRTDGVDTVLRAAYDRLVQEPLKRIEKLPHGKGVDRRLVFVADGPMNGLPFPALKSSDGYLMQKFIVSTAGSLALYNIARQLDALPAAASVAALLVGNPAFDRTAFPDAGDLPNAVTEVKEIQSRYPSSVLLVGQTATIERFLAGARGKAIIHVAAHTFVNAAEPVQSYILLTPSRGNDGTLSSQTLLTQLRLDGTRLVVLSSCTSMAGVPVGLEGVAPLIRPFVAAGVPAVIGSLWEVKDATTAPLFVSFYERYRAGNDAAAAFTLAQREMLRSGKTDRASVMAWAPFQVIGYASSPAVPATLMKENHNELRTEDPVHRPDRIHSQ